MPLFRVFRAFLGGFMGLVCVRCAFVLLACFAWLAWLLCACGVRRIKGLWRVLPFVFFFSPLVLSFSPFVLLSPALLLGFLPCLLSCSLSCFLGFVAWLLGCCFFFPYGRPDKKKGRAVLVRPLLSCCGLLYLVASLYSSYSSGVSPSIS